MEKGENQNYENNVWKKEEEEKQKDKNDMVKEQEKKKKKEEKDGNAPPSEAANVSPSSAGTCRALSRSLLLPTCSRLQITG